MKKGPVAEWKRHVLVVNAVLGDGRGETKADAERFYKWMTDPQIGSAEMPATRPGRMDKFDRLYDCPSAGVFYDRLTEYLADWEPQNQFIFYFSGHGRNHNGLYQIRMGPLDQHWLDFASVLNRMAERSVSRAILILDSCQSGSVSLEKGPSNYNEEIQLPENPPPGVVILCSSRPHEASVVGSGQSVFTQLLSTFVENGLRPKRGRAKQFLSVAEAGAHIRGVLEKDPRFARVTQRPFLKIAGEVSNEERPIWLARNIRWKSRAGRRTKDLLQPAKDMSREVSDQLASVINDKPWREGAVIRYNLQPIKDTDWLQVTEDTRYTCRAGEQGLQAAVVLPLQHPADLGTSPPIKEAQGLKLIVPAGFTAPEEFDQTQGGVITVPADRLTREEVGGGRWRLLFDLAPFRACDGLQVEFYRTFSVYGPHYITYLFGLPTLDAEVSLFYPRDFNLRWTSFGIEDSDLYQEPQETWLRLRTRKWVLPGWGFAFQVTRRDSSPQLCPAELAERLLAPECQMLMEKALVELPTGSNFEVSAFIYRIARQSFIPIAHFKVTAPTATRRAMDPLGTFTIALKDAQNGQLVIWKAFQAKQLTLEAVTEKQVDSYGEKLARINPAIRCVLACPVFSGEHLVGMLSFAAAANSARAWSAPAVRAEIVSLAQSLNPLLRNGAIPEDEL